MDAPEPSLKELFNSAKTSQDDLDSLDPRSANFKGALQSIIDSLRRCRQLIQQLSLFSTNEEVEDVSTQDLQFVTTQQEQGNPILTRTPDILL